jgi:hypothetical protein
MIRTLAIISLAGFLLSAVCLTLAATLAGPDALASSAWSWTGHSWKYDWRPRHGVSWSSDASTADGARESRKMAWSGEALELDVPADVRVTQAEGPPSLWIEGPKDALAHVVVNNGRIRWDGPGQGDEDLTIRLTAPKITRFTLNGSGSVEVEGYRQDNLALRLNGSTNATFHGAAKSVDAAISGDGDLDLSDLAVDNADLRVSGSGNAKAGPKRFARVDISGSGDVTLTTRPPRQETHISGSGRIEQEDGSETEQPSGDRT